MKIRRFEDLECWKEARKLVSMVYEAVKLNGNFQNSASGVPVLLNFDPHFMEGLRMMIGRSSSSVNISRWSSSASYPASRITQTKGASDSEL